MSTDEGDVVLDPFSGTGTTAIAAKRLGRNYIGFERDKEYVEIAESKLNHELPNSRIGDVWVSYFLKGILTLRDKDWENISQHFIIPEQIEQIDYIEINLKGLEQSCVCPPRSSKKSKLEDSPSLPY
jgi:site-specific DNA-methyltransferase (adenine-specific)